MSYGPMTEEEFHVTVIITREVMKYHIELPEEVCNLIGLIVVQAEREYERLRQMYLRRNRRMYRRSARWYEAHMGALRAAHEGLGDRWYRNSLHPTVAYYFSSKWKSQSQSLAAKTAWDLILIPWTQKFLHHPHQFTLTPASRREPFHVGNSVDS